jgi:ArsR family transcriptional regulator, arsenate/arsenite/antimonite-responsive transcriptional repressor
MEFLTATRALASLAHETRLGIFRLLVQAGNAGLSVGQINQTVQVAPATLSFHLKELAHAGLITSRQESRFVYYRADYDAMNALLAYLTKNCCQGETCSPVSICNPKGENP